MKSLAVNISVAFKASTTHDRFIRSILLGNEARFFRMRKGFIF